MHVNLDDHPDTEAVIGLVLLPFIALGVIIIGVVWACLSALVEE